MRRHDQDFSTHDKFLADLNLELFGSKCGLCFITSALPTFSEFVHLVLLLSADFDTSATCNTKHQFLIHFWWILYNPTLIHFHLVKSIAKLKKTFEKYKKILKGWIWSSWTLDKQDYEIRKKKNPSWSIGVKNQTGCEFWTNPCEIYCSFLIKFSKKIISNMK